jgi:hypothetical protein
MMVFDHPVSADRNNSNLAGRNTPVFWNGMGTICNEWLPFVFYNRNKIQDLRFKIYYRRKTGISQLKSMIQHEFE